MMIADVRPRTATPPPVLELEGLSKDFRGEHALDGVGFAVPAASLTVVLGPAGTGKTTLLRLIAGLDRPDAGRILLAGRDSSGLQPKDRDIAMIFDNLALYPDKTGFANIASPLVIHSLGREAIEERVNRIAATLQISHVLKRLPKTMSGGERQRVALGRALVRDPALFLLDEPLSSLDAKLRIDLRAELKRLQRDHGHTFLLATPDYAEALAVADTVVMMRKGRVVQIAAPQALYDDPADREVARFIGSPEINLTPARFVPVEGGRLRVAEALLPAPAGLVSRLPSPDVELEAGIRPENVFLADPETAPIRATLTDIEPLGLKAALTVGNAESELRLLVDAPTAQGLKSGDAVGLRLGDVPMLVFERQSGRRLA